MRKSVVVIASLLLLCGLATCAEQGSPTDEARHRFKDAGVTAVDASPTPPPQTGTVSCYNEGSPGNTCTLPAHCCFSNYSAQHDGACMTSSCSYGSIDCDGPEDCASGDRCCSHAIIDPNDGLLGYALACQASACGSAPVDYELCHPDGPPCSNGGSCVPAHGNDNDLPRTLYICL
jgi:hypothetical protein